MDVEKHGRHKFVHQTDQAKLSKIRNITSYDEIVGEFRSDWVEITHDRCSAVNKVPGLCIYTVKSRQTVY